MFALTRKTDYALVALCHLARSPVELTSAREIAERYQMPLPVVMNIMKALSREGIVSSVRGSRGGYGLAIDPADISVRMVIRAIEGPVRLFACATDGEFNGSCELQGHCPMLTPAQRISERFRSFLDRLSLKEIADDSNCETQLVSVSNVIGSEIGT